MSASSVPVILTFRCVHDALAAEQVLAGRGISCDLIPVPVGISSDCGFCLLVDGDLEGPGAAVLGETRVEGRWRVVLGEAKAGGRKERRYERED